MKYNDQTMHDALDLLKKANEYLVAANTNTKSAYNNLHRDLRKNMWNVSVPNLSNEISLSNKVLNNMNTVTNSIVNLELINTLENATFNFNTMNKNSNVETLSNTNNKPQSLYYYMNGEIDAAMKLSRKIEVSNRIEEIEKEINRLRYGLNLTNVEIENLDKKPIGYEFGKNKAVNVLNEFKDSSFSPLEDDIAKLQQEKNQLSKELKDINSYLTLVDYKIKASNLSYENARGKLNEKMEVLRKYYSENNGYTDYLDYLSSITEHSLTQLNLDVPNILMWYYISEECGISRKSYIQDYLGMQIESSLETMALCYMTDDEFKIYITLFVNNSEDAKNYLENIKQSLNERRGVELAYKVVKEISDSNVDIVNVLESYGFGVVDGVIQWVENSAAFFNPDETVTVNEYKSMYVLQILGIASQVSKEITGQQLLELLNSGILSEEQYNNLKTSSPFDSLDFSKYQTLLKPEEEIEFLKKGYTYSNINKTTTYLDLYNELGLLDSEEYDLISQVSQRLTSTEIKVLDYSYNIGMANGNMLPSMVVSAAFQGAGLINASKVIGNLMMFFSGAGGGVKEGLRNNASMSKAYFYGIASGFSESATNYYLGSIPFLSKGSKFFDSFLNNNGNACKVFLGLLSDSISEIGEEEFQNIFNHYLSQEILDVPFNYNLENLGNEAIDTMIVTFFSTIIANGGSIPAQLILNHNNQTIVISESQIFEYLNSDGTINYEGLKNSLNNNIQSPITNLLYDTDLEGASDTGIQNQEIIEKVSQTLITNIDSFFKKFSSGNDTYYGGDQNVSQKHSLFEITNLDILRQHLDGIANYLDQSLEQQKLKQSISKEREDKIRLQHLEFIKKLSAFDLKLIDREDLRIIEGYLSSIAKSQIEFTNLLVSFLKRNSDSEYVKLQTKLQDAGFSLPTSRMILDNLNVNGLCSYAALANAIFTKFKDNSSAFEKYFGYSMFTTINGEQKLNTSELMLDLYLFANSNLSNPKINIFENSDGKYKVNSNFGEGNLINLMKAAQVSVSGWGSMNTTLINGFLEYKGIPMSVSVDNIKYGSQADSQLVSCSVLENVSDLYNIISNALNNNGLIKVGIFQEKLTEGMKFSFVNNSNSNDVITTDNWEEGGAHAVFVTGISDLYLHVASWGKEYVIKLTDFINNKFDISIINFGGK